MATRHCSLALTRVLGDRLFARVLDVLQRYAPRTTTTAELMEALAAEIVDFNRGWLRKRLCVASKDPSSFVTKVIPAGNCRSELIGNSFSSRIAALDQNCTMVVSFSRLKPISP